MIFKFIFMFTLLSLCRPMHASLSEDSMMHIVLDKGMLVEFERAFDPLLITLDKSPKSNYSHVISLNYFETPPWSDF